MLSVRKYTMAYDSSHGYMGSWRVWMTLKDITLKEICQRYNDSTVWFCYENKKYRMSEAETRRHLGGKQWAEVKRGDGQSLIKTSLGL